MFSRIESIAQKLHNIISDYSKVKQACKALQQEFSSLNGCCGNISLPVCYYDVPLNWKSRCNSYSDDGQLLINDSELFPHAMFECEITSGFIKKMVDINFSVGGVPKKIGDIDISTILGANSNPNDIKSDLFLPEFDWCGNPLRWESNSEAITPEGHVANGIDHRPVTLTVFGKNENNTFNFIVNTLNNVNCRKTLVIVPHGDDEMFLCGSVINERIRQGENVWVCFCMNNDRDSKGGDIYAGQRHKQIIDALGFLGVHKSRIISLGYSSRWKNEHIYNSREDDVCVSSTGRVETYSTESLKDYHFVKTGKHAQYTVNNFKNDLKSVIHDIMPDEIFSIDMDSHVDHQAVSLLFDHAMGELLTEISNYRPTVYKGFAYCMGCYSVKKTFRNIVEEGITEKPLKKLGWYGELPNPAYSWVRRTQFINTGYKNCDINITPVEQGLLRYKRMYTSICKFQHNDTCFWKRETNNLLRSADVHVSSGNRSALTDFVIADSSQIGKRFIRYDKGVWKPTDKSPWIEAIWNEKIKIETIVLYYNPVLGLKIHPEVWINGTKQKVKFIQISAMCFALEIHQCNIFCLKLCWKHSVGLELTEIEVLNAINDSRIINEQSCYRAMRLIYPVNNRLDCNIK